MKFLAKCANLLLDNYELWLFPAVLFAAWFYYPYCQTGPSLCLWKAIFHRPCIGCGLTRGVCFLVHGRLRDSIRFNPLSAVFVVSTGIAFVKALSDLRGSFARRHARVPQGRTM